MNLNVYRLARMVHSTIQSTLKSRCYLDKNLDLGRYARRRRSFRVERNRDFSSCAMLSNAQISGVPRAT